ncbi:hypothetical protein [Bacteroides stercorirosoris]|nr:hypothetical protein [Bacteroides stercorirosoris]
MKSVEHSALWTICEKDKGDKYVELQNSVGQRWYIPLRNSSVHLSLFQPSSIQGKIVVYLFEIIKHFPIILHIIHAKIVRLQFTKDFQDIIENIFKTNHCTFGVFCGSPGYHQKPTLLISKGKYILGYCKLTDNEYVKKLFQDENENLTYLHSKGIINVPTPLFCDHLPFRQSILAFIQSTNRNREKKVKIATYTNQKLIDFVKQTNTKTKVAIPFNDSDFSKSINNLEQHIHLLKDMDMKDTLKSGISMINENRDSFKYFCASHGDLTPWNSFIVQNGFFAFDLEYFKKSYTPWYDYFHFFTQEMLYNNHANAEQIYLKYKDLRSHFFLNQNNVDLFYLSYLLIIFEFYLNRDNGILNDRINECMEIWASLIKHILENVSKNN